MNSNNIGLHISKEKAQALVELLNKPYSFTKTHGPNDPAWKPLDDIKSMLIYILSLED